jgi:hypothetical protein
VVVNLAHSSSHYWGCGVSALMNAVLQPASQAPQLRRFLAGACRSIDDKTIALACPMRSLTTS